jgi:hypothetical protein
MGGGHCDKSSEQRQVPERGLQNRVPLAKGKCGGAFFRQGVDNNSFVINSAAATELPKVIG